MLDLKKFKLNEAILDSDQPVQIEKVSNRDIAIIGMACRFSDADSPEEYWQNLRLGRDLVRPFPLTRRADADAFLKVKGVNPGETEYYEAAYLEQIDKFDPAFFKISPKEASLMDPNQRLFLSTAWQAIEDAGYGGKKLAGSDTGVYLGFTSDFGYEYKRLVNELEQSSGAISLAGNIKSIIASRIAYVLDLKGPSMAVDTACSSALTAVHLACTALRNGECEQALVGAVKIHLFPLAESEDGAGIRSSVGRARTFDESSDGTGSGEGSAVVLLKPLKKAEEDGDTIYAVIKGSAVNQDGSSIGITAPNSLAQAAVIEKAWKDAGIDPESISYIEAHGTGTKLGDPIEIDGISRAFRKYTRRSQFCGIGSVKTNIGHLDNAAGMAGLMKAVLALKYGELPASLHFQKPNPKIDFANSPVYVVDSLRKWQPKAGMKRCGVSAFGLSGTNCHVVLEEAPAKSAGNRITSGGMASTCAAGQGEASLAGPQILTISAMSKGVLDSLLAEYREFFAVEQELDLTSVCYTANTGRGHYAFRAALLVTDLLDAREKLAKLELGGQCPEGVYFSEVKVRKEEERRELNALAEAKVKELAAALVQHERTAEVEVQNQAISGLLLELAELYVKGAEIEWEDLYRQQKVQKVNLPVYPFEEKRCWVRLVPPETQKGGTLAQLMNVSQFPGSKSVSGDQVAQSSLHPLLERCVEHTAERAVFVTDFNPAKHWVLSEHKVGGNCVVPGTSYLEMAREAGRKFYPEGAIQLKDVMFISPLIANSGETREVQTIVKNCGEYLEFSVISEDGLLKHTEGKIFPTTINSGSTQIIPEITEANTSTGAETCAAIARLDIAALKAGKEKHTYIYDDDLAQPDTARAIETGPRWKNLHELYAGENEVLAYLELRGDFLQDLAQFTLHPALLDRAVNVASQHVGQGLYLPFSYTELKIYGATPAAFYSYLRMKKEANRQETFSFDLTLADTEGRVFMEVEGYTIKKVHETGARFKDLVSRSNLYYETGWITQALDALTGERRRNWSEGTTLVLKDTFGYAENLIAGLVAEGAEVIEVTIGSKYTILGENQFTISGTEEDYVKLIGELKERNLTRVLHLLTAGEVMATDFPDLVRQERDALYSPFYLTKALLNQKAANNLELIILSDHAFAHTAAEWTVNPLHASLFALGKVIAQEYTNLKVRCIDLDVKSDAGRVIDEMSLVDGPFQVVYRQGQRYIEEFRKVEINTIPDREFTLRSDGIYLITGGTGGIGLEMAKYLALQAAEAQTTEVQAEAIQASEAQDEIAQIKAAQGAKLTIALLNRSQFPVRAEWVGILEANADRRLCHKLRMIEQIEALGTTVEVVSADVSDLEQMTAVVSDLKTRYGRINGVIHGAGNAGDGFMLRKDSATFGQVLAPKIRGTWILDHLTRTDRPDFFVLLSSVNAVIGGPGQSDYTAANSYLDAYAAYGSTIGLSVTTINWPAWTEVGMAADYGVEGGIFGAIAPTKAIEVFAEILRREIKRVIVGELNYNLIARPEVVLPLALSAELAQAVRNRQNRLKTVKETTMNAPKAVDVVIKGREEEEYNEVEVAVARIWGEVLGLDAVDIDANFYDLGGDSILATHLLKALNQNFPGLVDISDIFTYSTVSDMAGYIEGKLAKKQAPAETSPATQEMQYIDTDLDMLDSILDQLESGELAVDDAEIFTVRRENQ